VSVLPFIPAGGVETAADVFPEICVFQQVLRLELATLAFFQCLNHGLSSDLVLRLLVLRVFLDLSHHFSDIDLRTPALGLFDVKFVSKRVRFFFVLRLLSPVAVAECQILADCALA